MRKINPKKKRTVALICGEVSAAAEEPAEPVEPDVEEVAVAEVAVAEEQGPEGHRAEVGEETGTSTIF